MPRRACAKDANHDEIAGALLQLGWWVVDTSQAAQVVPGFPDLLAAKAGMTVLIEVKTRRGRLTPAESVFQMLWPDRYRIVRRIEDVEAIEAEWREGV